MPSLNAKVCAYAGCRAVVHGQSRCQRHAKAAWHSTSSSERGYGAQWRKRRERVLRRDNYLCVPCAESGRVTPAHAVDHKIARAEGGTEDDSNLQAICRSCHAMKTGREGGIGGSDVHD
jgi:5-methylcytosine-specific restriction protein A